MAEDNREESRSEPTPEEYKKSLRTILVVLDDDIFNRRKDLNSIYKTLQEDMEDHPEIAEFVARKMSRSLTLEEANLIGETALVVYNAMNALYNLKSSEGPKPPESCQVYALGYNDSVLLISS